MVKLFSLISLGALTYFAARKWASFQFKQEVKLLFSLSKNCSHKHYSKTQIADLPEPVQRYFKLVLKEGQPFINQVRLQHNGQFKTNLDKDWVDIQGEQYFTTNTPGFIWIGKTNLFVARDLFLAGTGELKVKLFSLFTVAEGSGPKYDQGELLRWLGESAWFPTNLLPSAYISWSPINENAAQLTCNYHNQTVGYKVSFNQTGEITQMETRRYLGDKDLENWVGRFSDYRVINDVLVPTTAEGIWQLPTGEFPYVNFKVKTIEYNKPELF